MNEDLTPSHKNTASLDRNQLQQVRKNYLALNAYRLHFARETFPENQRLYLDLLPALLHFNHPMLPGYCDRQTPAGVFQYQASEVTRLRLQRLAKSFHPNRNKNQRPDIVSVFTMGSLGSVAQNSQSDIDVWLCYRADLSDDGLRLLTQKAEKISVWATTFGIDTTIFLMNPKDFYSGANQALDKESSGNMQHLLLLDEFYRTAIFIAGQLPIWFFTTHTNAKHYLIETRKLLEDRRLPDKQMIDFGAIDRIPNGEFISAAIWQLYKAIESPYKSIIKLLLIEIYATQNQAATFLSNQFKQWLHTADFDEPLCLEFYDPFYQSYRFIESYLITTNQDHRLALVRRCFYFKVAQPAIKSKHSSGEQKKQFIRTITQQWQWDDAFIENLNQHEQWKTQSVNQERREIISALNESYRFIINFCKKDNVAIRASNKELNILGRKLHAAFSKKSGKVDWLNPGISSNITEAHISFKQEPNRIWHASNQQHTILSKKSLIELVVNLYCNQIITDQTKLTFDKKHPISLEKIRSKISSKIPAPLQPISHNHFEQKCSTQKIILFLHSFENPDYYLVPDKPEQQRYYLTQHCVIDMVTINSWNEITCQQFTGKAEHIIPEVLSRFLTEPQCLEHLHSEFFDANIAHALRSYMTRLIRSLIDFFSQHSHGRFFIENSSGMIGLSNLSSETSYTFFDSLKKVKMRLSEPQNNFCALGVDKASLSHSMLDTFAHYNHENCIQIFFTVKGQLADITIIDEQGTFYFLSIHYRNPQHSLLPIYTYCRAVNERRKSCSTQELSPLDILPISIYKLQQQQQQWRAEQIYVNNQATLESQFLIHGAVQYQQDDFIFTLYCADQCFSEADEPAEALPNMLNWMRAQAKNQQPLRYTITDLDITHCQGAFAPGQVLHTTHYLQVKTALEQKITRALGTVNH